MAGTIASPVKVSRPPAIVSMESGLDGRNNDEVLAHHSTFVRSLNGVRPRWPEQSPNRRSCCSHAAVSMESGLDGRNNVNDAEQTAKRQCKSQWSPA